MALFPGDMNIGWGFGRYPQEELSVFKDEPECDPDGYHPDEPHLTDPLLAVSELEQRVHEIEKKLGEVPQDAVLWYLILDLRVTQQSDRRVLEGIRDMTYDHSDVLKQAIQRITDLEERLRSLCVVVNSLVSALEEKE